MFAVPMVAQAPSTVAVLACTMAPVNRKIRTPAPRSWPK